MKIFLVADLSVIVVCLLIYGVCKLIDAYELKKYGDKIFEGITNAEPDETETKGEKEV